MKPARLHTHHRTLMMELEEAREERLWLVGVGLCIGIIPGLILGLCIGYWLF